MKKHFKLPQLDLKSLVVTCDADLSITFLEEWLNKHKMTLGYQPSNTKIKTLREALEVRSSNLFGHHYGEIDDICLSLKAKQKDIIAETKRVSRAATGPDFKKILIGSGQKYGIILEVNLRVVPLPEKKERLQIHWKTSERKNTFLKKLSSSGIRPLRIMPSIAPHSLLVELEGIKNIVEAESICLTKLSKETEGKLQNLYQSK